MAEDVKDALREAAERSRTEYVTVRREDLLEALGERRTKTTRKPKGNREARAAVGKPA